MNIILSDAGMHKRMLPLSYTRAIADFRCGFLTIKEKWEQMSGSKVSVITEDYLQAKYPLSYSEINIVVNASIVPDPELVKKILQLKSGALVKDDYIIAIVTSSIVDADFSVSPDKPEKYENDIRVINHLPDLFLLNGEQIKSDMQLICKDRKSENLSATNIVIGNNDVFVEQGAFVEACSINTIDGPVYIGKNAQVMEGSNIRGPIAICDEAVVKMGAKIYGGTTIGPGSKVGGEINNSIFFANSNKAHDGFLGNAVIGEWCNLGADTNNSNLKNNYAKVKLWNYEKESFIDTGLQFCGLFMGDHSKSGINTMFNTGTVVGVSANIFGAGFPRNFVPSFTWGGHGGVKEYALKTALETMQIVLGRRDHQISKIDMDIINEVFNRSARFRK
jgi:UDP-N-acetylglucosamine diphosphorylase/glucosamine-1-phosphate N-acetyltransferase